MTKFYIQFGNNKAASHVRFQFIYQVHPFDLFCQIPPTLRHFSSKKMEGFSWTTNIQTQATGICIRRNAKESFAFNEIKLDTYCCREPLMSVHIGRFLMRCRKPQNSEWVVHPFFSDVTKKIDDKYQSKVLYSLLQSLSVDSPLRIVYLSLSDGSSNSSIC